MPLITHGNLKNNNGIHIAYSFTYADSTARSSAAGLLAADVGKFALQQNDKSIWMLTNHSPVTWKLLSLEAHAHVISDITNLQDVLDGKSATGHDHVISDITGLSTAISDIQGVNSAQDSAISDLQGENSAQDSAISAKAPINNPTFTGTVSGITKAMVGLGNVDNTSDADKPVSSATQTALNAKAASSLIGAAEGVCPLDSGAKVSTSYLPDSILGQVSYQGTWSASTNVPAIPAAATGNKGHYYICTTGVASNHGYANVPAMDFVVGDWIISNGSAWGKVDNTDSISSFNGRTGAISPISGDYASFYEPTITTLPVNKGRTGVDATNTAQKYFLASPNDATGAPTFRAILPSDIPILNQNTTGSADTAAKSVALDTRTTAGFRCVKATYDELNMWIELSAYVYPDMQTGQVKVGVADTSANSNNALVTQKIRTSAPSTPTDGDIWMV